MDPTKFPIIHVAKMQRQNQGFIYCFLRKIEPYRYIWFLEDSTHIEKETPIWGGTSEEAIAAAYKAWKIEFFNTLNCGFRYTLPERDEVGTNALFYQMVASYRSMTGVYFDEELHANCIVQFASQEARELSKRCDVCHET